MSTYPLSDAFFSRVFNLPFVNRLFKSHVPHLSHQSLLDRFDALGVDTTTMYLKRTTTLASVIAGRGVPLDVGPGVDMARLFRAIGFDVDRYAQLSPRELERAANRHLFRMELGFAKLFDNQRAMNSLYLFDSRLDPSSIDKIEQLLPHSGITYSTNPTQNLHAHYQEILQHQDPAELMIPILGVSLSYVEERSNKIPMEAMKLALMSKGIGVEPIEIKPEDREVLFQPVTLKLAGESGETLAHVRWLIESLNSFLAKTPPEDRGVIRGRARLKNLKNLYNLAIQYPTQAKALIRAALCILSPVFTKERGADVRKGLYRIADLILGEGNAAYRKTLLRAGHSPHINPQFMEDVTDPRFNNAWQTRQHTPTGEEVTHAEILRVLTDFMRRETNSRYLRESNPLLRQMGIAPIVRDLSDAVMQFVAASKENPEMPSILFANHGSFLDILLLGEQVMGGLLSFFSRASLLPKIPGIANYLAGGGHANMNRNSPDLAPETREKNRLNAIREYKRIWRWAPTATFPQKTRSKLGSWRDLKEPGDGVLAKLYRSSARSILETAREYVAKSGQDMRIHLLLAHLSHSKEAFMTTKAGVGDVLGLRNPLRFIANFAKIPVYDPVEGARISIDFHPLIVIDPDDSPEHDEMIINGAIAFHDDMEQTAEEMVEASI